MSPAVVIMQIAVAMLSGRSVLTFQKILLPHSQG